MIQYSGFFTAEMHSCTDFYKSGARNNGKYSVFTNNTLLKVYCDFESEATSKWTLVMSYALKNVANFNKPLYVSDLVNGRDPNWESYRYLSIIKHILVIKKLDVRYGC